MDHFKLPGRPTMIFKVVKRYDALPTAPRGRRCPSVKGVTLDGLYETHARVADVVEVLAVSQ